MRKSELLEKLKAIDDAYSGWAVFGTPRWSDVSKKMGVILPVLMNRIKEEGVDNET